METFVWQDIIDGETEASGEPINRMAKAVQNNRDFLNKLPTDFELQKNKNVAGGYAGLDNNGKVLEQNLPEKIVFSDDDGKINEDQIPDNIARTTDIPAPVDISGKEDKVNKGIAGGYASLDKNGKVPTSQLPDNIGGGSDLSIMIPSDIEYEIIEGKVVAFGGKSIKDNADCFTVFVRIPEKKVAAVYATARNAKDGNYDSWLAICDSDKTPIANLDGAYNNAGITTTDELSVFGANYINNYEDPVYCALSYTNGTAFEVGLFGADVVDKNYIPISETDLPDDFMLKANNLFRKLVPIEYSANNTWIYRANKSTNFFEVTNGDVLYHNGGSNVIYLKYFDENYTYVASSAVLNSGGTITPSDTVKYAYAYHINSVLTDDFWISKTDLSQRKYKPNRIVNPEYVDLNDIDKKQLNSWYKGKNISFMGDSLTGLGTGGFYINYLDNYFKFGTKTNCGSGGTLVSGDKEKSFWKDIRVNAIDIDSDVVFIMGGTNDAINNATIGEFSLSNCDTNTFVGAYNVLISKILYKFFKFENGYYSEVDYSGVTQVEIVKPIKIFLVTPPYGFGSTSGYVTGAFEKYKAFADAVKEIGKLTGYPVCDIQANSGINDMLAEYYKTGTDYLHLNDEAHKEWAKVMIGKMLEVEPIE